MNISDGLNHLLALGETSPDPKSKRLNIPKGWEAHVELDDNGGVLVSTPREARPDDPTETELFDEFDLDSNRWRVTSLRKSRWQRWDGEWLEAFRATFIPKHLSVEASTIDVEKLMAEVKSHKPAKFPKPTGEYGYVVATGDTQLGKIDGDGTSGTVNRVLTKTDASVQRFKDLRKIGYEFGEVCLPWLGDCVEGNQSQGGNASAAGRVELSITEQIRLFRRLLLRQIKTVAPLSNRIVVPVIPGNHDEAERRGSIVRSYTDSWAVETAISVADILDENPDAYSHVSIVVPKRDELTVTIDVAGTILALAHGHQFGRDVLKWWQGQQHGRQPVGEAHILLGAHLHHLTIQETGKDRVFMQVPSMDGGSTWFRHRAGDDTRSGVLTFVTNNAQWSELTIL